ncbi:TonB-dependent receptor [Epilithonimonas tenax]|uniref:TonB-dependent receptor n=1 Tax=Epilithonimonas tenax TaxID=191577 RepID=UPI000686F429|nr:TonB-dependent receptor [Epilithonimonas tenax]
MKYMISLLLICFGLASVSAQKYAVEGMVQDFHDKTPLQNVVVSFGAYTAKTDKSGTFRIKNVAAGKYTLSASHPDCDNYAETLTVGKDLHLTINLEHHVNQIETVTLHGSHKNNGTMVVKTLDKTEIERNSTENLGNLLKNISGVSGLKTGNNIVKPIIHGLYGSRISIINNGVRMQEQEWGIEHAPNIDVNNFQHIDVIKGASALRYGSDAIGGVVVLEPEIFPKKDTLKGAVNLSGISNGRGLGVDVNLAKIWKNGWAVKAGGSIRKTGDQSARAYNLKNTGSDFSSFNFTVQKNTFKNGFSFDYYLTDQNLGILRDSHVTTPRDYFEAMNAQVPFYSGNFSYEIDNPRQLIQHHLAKVSAFNRFENIGKVSVTYSFQYNHRQEFDLRRGDLSKIPSLDLALMTHQLNINDLLEREKWSLETGIDASFQNNYSDPATQARRLIPNYDKYSAGIYSVFKYKITPELNAEAGIRYDHNYYDVTKWYDKSDWEKLYAEAYPEFYVRTNANRVLTRPKLTYHNLSYNAGLEYHPSNNFNLKLNYAKVGRTPNIAELFSDGLHHSAAIIEKGNMAIKNEEGHQFNIVADAKFDILKGLEISVNPYYFITKNFINQIPDGTLQLTQAGTFPVWVYQQIDAKMGGLDVDIHLGISDHFSYRGRGAYVRGQDETHDEPLILMMPMNFSNALQFHQQKWNGFYLNIENQILIDQKRYPVHNLEFTDYVAGEEVTTIVDISTPPQTYAIWNVQAGIDIGKNFSAGLTVNNVFNLSYRDYLNRMRLFANDMGRNFILNFRYKF